MLDYFSGRLFVGLKVRSLSVVELLDSGCLMYADIKKYSNFLPSISVSFVCILVLVVVYVVVFCCCGACFDEGV